jgi:hypothetical protein
MDSYYNQYINQYRIYTAMSADKLASFRVDSQLWEQFQGYAKSQNNTATALLISYIKSVVNTGNVITSSQNINTSSQSNNPSLSIQDIDKRIDDKVKQSIQNIDTINTLSIQDIDNRINESLADGDIGGAIAASYKAAMGQFGGLLEEMQELKKQLEELKAAPPAPPAPIPQSPITNPQLPTTNDELIEVLGIQDIIAGQIYNFDSLKEDGIIDAIKENQALIENFIGDKMSLKNDLSDMNKMLKFMGFEIERTTKDNKKYNRAKMPK